MDVFWRLEHEGLLPALRAVWDSIAPYSAVPPTRARGRSEGDVFQGSPAVWLKRILALNVLSKHYATVLQLDSDNYPCIGWPALFDTRASLKVQVLSARPIVPFSGSSGNGERPAPPGLSATERARWVAFSERNLGFLMLHTASAGVRQLLRAFAAEYVRQVNDSSLARLVSDQPAWRVVLFSSLQAERLREHVVASSKVCRLTSALLEHHTARHGQGACGTCLFMHHKKVAEAMRQGAWEGLANATQATASWPWRKQQLLGALDSFRPLATTMQLGGGQIGAGPSCASVHLVAPTACGPHGRSDAFEAASTTWSKACK